MPRGPSKSSPKYQQHKTRSPASASYEFAFPGAICRHGLYSQAMSRKFIFMNNNDLKTETKSGPKWLVIGLIGLAIFCVVGCCGTSLVTFVLSTVETVNKNARFDAAWDKSDEFLVDYLKKKGAESVQGELATIEQIDEMIIAGGTVQWQQDGKNYKRFYKVVCDADSQQVLGIRIGDDLLITTAGETRSHEITKAIEEN